MLNKIILMGRLTRDPELKKTPAGTDVASFSIACERDRAAAGAEKETDFIDCVAWRKTAEFVSNWLRKGMMVILSGRLQIRAWTDKDGNKRRAAEVVCDEVYFGESKKESAPAQYRQSDPEAEEAARQRLAAEGMIKGYEPKPEAVADFEMMPGDDSDLPF